MVSVAARWILNKEHDMLKFKAFYSSELYLRMITAEVQ